MAAGDLLSSEAKPSSNKGGAIKGWLSSVKPAATEPPHRKWSSADGSSSKADQRWSNDSSSPDEVGAAVTKGGTSGSLWSPEIAAAMGYGKKGRSGSAFQWWILILAGLLAIASFIAWVILVFKARDSTQAALEMLRVDLPWWGTLKAVLLATAVCFPVLTLAAIGVSLWRAVLAHKLNIHAPDAAWMKSSRAFQFANVVSSCLLYGMLLLLLVSLGAHSVWAFSARTAHVSSWYAIKYVDPIWNGTASVVQASQNLVQNFVGLAQALPVVGRKLQGMEEQDDSNVLIIGGRRLTQADLESMPPEVLEAGLAAARSLQQLPSIFNNLGGWLANTANAINNVPTPTINTANLANNLPFLPQLLPNGTSNPLFNTLRAVTDAVQTQLLNSTGCPIYCIDLRNQSWIQDGCVCNLERVKAAYPHVSQVYGQAIPAIYTLLLMMIASTWLLLHAASQWARTRSEAKLLGRIPHAAKHALAVQNSQQHQQQQQPSGVAAMRGSSRNGSSGGGSGPSAPLAMHGEAAVADVPAKQQPAPLASV